MRFLCLFLGTNFYLCYSNCFLCLWGGVESRTDLSWCVKIEKYQEEIQNTVCAKMQNTENAKYKIHKFKEKYKIKDRKLQRRNTKIRRRNINIPAEGGDRRRAGCAKIQKYKEEKNTKWKNTKKKYKERGAVEQTESITCQGVRSITTPYSCSEQNNNANLL